MIRDEILSDLRQRIKRLLSDIELMLQLQDVLQPYDSMRTNSAERQIADFHPMDHERSRNAKHF